MRYLSFVHDGISSWGMLGESGIVDLGQHLAALPAAVALETVTLAPVIPNPDKIVMAALNYYEPGQDRDDKPDYPVLFLRLPASQIGHGAPLIQPRSSQKLDYEGELAVIIGKGGRHIAREEAQSHVAGYAIYNDGSVRDWQRHSHQFTPGKNFVGTGAFGPWMVSSDALSLPPEGLSLVTRVNGVEKQRTDTSRMIFDVPYLISYISTFTPLEPGDVIVTGTCEGFGATRTPQEFLTPGDLVEVEIDGLGLLANRVAVEAS